MKSTSKPSLSNWTAILRVLSFCYSLSISIGGASAVLYSDGKSHSIDASLDDAITLRSSSILILDAGDFTIRSPTGKDSAIRLSMSSALNATGGDIIGGDADGEHPAGAGVIVGSASRAEFHDGVTVRGGNHPGDGDGRVAVDSARNLVGATNDLNDNNAEGHGGDALVSQYVGSNATIVGGNFMAGKGAVRDGYSLVASYEGQIYVQGGTYYGSWMARDGGSIVVTGCLSRIGTRLVGRLQDGLALDVQLVEEGGGEIIVNSPEKCNTYRKPHFSGGRNIVGSAYYSLFGVMILCWAFAL